MFIIPLWQNQWEMVSPSQQALEEKGEINLFFNNIF